MLKMATLNRIGALFTTLCLLCACTNDDPGKSAAPAAPVHVASVERGDMSRELDAVGNVRASASVAITPRVDGEIIEVNFTEGEEVKAGQTILRIDPRPYAAILAEKNANLAKSRAQLQKAKNDRARYARLVQDGYISREAYEQTATDEAALIATVAADQAAARRAELDLSYCSIQAPISGRIGELKMHKGNMVKDNDTGPVCTIDAISPCYINFSVPEAHLSDILAYMKQGELTITAKPIGGRPETGIVTLVDNSVDTKTGAIRLRATFENKSKNLWPGQFVEIKLPLGAIKNAIILPSRAIQTGRDESFVYVVDADGKAIYHKVAKLLDQDGKTAVAADIQPGDRVVTEGQIRLTPGASVLLLDDK